MPPFTRMKRRAHVKTAAQCIRVKLHPQGGSRCDELQSATFELAISQRRVPPIMDSTTTKLRASGLALSVALLITNFSSCGYAQETIKIGVIAPNSGPYTIIGEEVRNGFSLYLAEIGNTAGGRKLE